MKTPLHRPIDPSTHGPIRLAALVAAHLRKGILNCSDLQGSQVFALDSVLKFRREMRVWLNGEALPICHANSYFKFSGLSRGKVDKLIARHLQALERLLHSQHVFAHQFASQGVQHFLWAWQSLSPSNIFKPCTRAYERCMRRIYGTLKNKNPRSKCTCLVKA